MNENIRKAIDTLGAVLRDYTWELHSGAIRTIGIEGTDEYCELQLCPLATAVALTGSGRIKELMKDPEHDKFTRSVNHERPDVLGHLHQEQPEAQRDRLDGMATAYAAAAVVHDAPRLAETGLILDLDPDTVRAIAHAADKPYSDTGRALVRALESPNNVLRQEYDAHYGQLDAEPA